MYILNSQHCPKSLCHVCLQKTSRKEQKEFLDLCICLVRDQQTRVCFKQSSLSRVWMLKFKYRCSKRPHTVTSSMKILLSLSRSLSSVIMLHSHVHNKDDGSRYVRGWIELSASHSGLNAVWIEHASWIFCIKFWCEKKGDFRCQEHGSVGAGMQVHWEAERKHGFKELV